MAELLQDAHFWIGVALVIFLAVLIKAGVHKLAWNALGASGDKIRAQLAEAEALRTEAQALLDQIKVQSAQAEKQAAEMMDNARPEAKRLEAEPRDKLAEQLARRTALAERRIATAE